MKTIAVLILMLSLAVSLHALKVAQLKDALKTALPAGKAFKTEITLTDETVAAMNAKFNSDYFKGEKFTIYSSKDEKGKILGYAVYMVEVLTKYNTYHRWVFAFDDKKNYQNVFLLEMTDEWSQRINNAAFLKQFRNVKDINKLKVNDTIDAVTTATESTELLILSIKKADYVLKTLYK